MNVTHLKQTGFEPKTFEKWEFYVDNDKYRYETFEAHLTYHGETIAAFSRLLKIGSKQKSYPLILTQVFKESGYRPLDKTNPQQTIERIFKLMMLQ